MSGFAFGAAAVFLAPPAPDPEIEPYDDSPPPRTPTAVSCLIGDWSPF